MSKNRSGRRAYQPIYTGRGPAPKGEIAVIDVGSNSIRLVVYDGLDRTPLPVFNEKVLCGLGRDLAETGKLYPEGIEKALRNVARFDRLLNELGVDRLDILATAAVRDAEDGPDFVGQLEEILGRDVTILPGEDEAKLAAYGVVAGMPGANGVVGDLGGGSLELVGLDEGELTQQITLPLGPFRVTGMSRSKVLELIDETLDKLDWLDYFKGLDFFPVGGAWRSIAKVHLATNEHPIRVIHNHSVPGRELRRLVSVIAQQGDASLAKLPGVSRRRLETLPHAALLMERLMHRLKPPRVVFSAYGLREGHLYGLLPPKKRAVDPLVHAAEKYDARSAACTNGEEIFEWLSPLFAGESAVAARQRLAACLLSDIAARQHPEYRAEHGFLLSLRAPLPGIDHAERAFIATSIYVRYGGKAGGGVSGSVSGQLDEVTTARARVLGTALRLAHTLTAGATGVLSKSTLRLDEGSIALQLEEEDAALEGEVVERRLEALARALDRPSEVQIGFSAAAE